MKNKIESARKIDLCRRAVRKDVQRAGLPRFLSRCYSASLYAAAESPCSTFGAPTGSDEGYTPQDAAMDVRDKVVRAVETDTPRNKATSLSSVRTKRAHKLSDDIRDQVLKAVEGGMTCRQAAAHCGVSLASAIRFAKRAGITDKRAKAKKNVRDKVHDKVLKAVKGGMSCHQAATHYGVSSTTALKWAKNANIPRTRTSTKRISDKVRDKVLKAVEGGMSCRQAAAHCGVSLASAIRWTKHLRT
jgi:transposase